MLTDRRVLVVEPEFLIALEVQRILEQVNAGEIVFTRSVEEAARLEPRFAEFDLAVVAMGVANAAAVALTVRLAAAGVAVVGTTAGLAGFVGLSADAAIPLVEKPFTDERLLAACAYALASPPTDEQACEIS